MPLPGAFPTRPPGPSGLPLLGNLLAFGADRLGFLSRSHREHGDLVSLNFAGWPTLLISDMEAIERVLVKDHRNFIKNTVIWRHTRALFGRGLLTSEGDLWQRQRRLAAPAFAGEQLLSYGPEMVAQTRRTIGAWSDGEIIDAHPEMMTLTLRIAAETLFDAQVEDDIATIDRAVHDLILCLDQRFNRPLQIPDWMPLPGNRRYLAAIASIEEVISRLVRERRLSGEAPAKRDLLSRLMTARDEHGQPMSDELIRDEAITALLAGHETTALAMSWAIRLLSLHPHEAEHAAREIDAVVGDGQVSSEHVDRLPRTEALVNEAMRLYPPAWVIGRESVGPFEAGGFQFPGGTTVLVSPWLLHRDPRWFERPEEFVPERWINRTQRLPRFAYMPFGGGPRICIGQRFAMMEAVLMLATILREFAFEPMMGKEPRPFPSITLRPEGGVWVKLRRRRVLPQTH
jgi:cytochrome P450